MHTLADYPVRALVFEAGDSLRELALASWGLAERIDLYQSCGRIDIFYGAVTCCTCSP